MAAAVVAVAVLLPSQMSGPRAYYGRCCVGVIAIVLRSDIYQYLQQTRDMEVAVELGSGTAGQNDNLVGPSKNAQIVVVLPPRARGGARAARESQDDDEISLLGGRCGRFLAVDSRDAM